ncbi:PREDICTED: uncharacterized protein LOC106103885 [Papilio polytes]|uniref:uncharacterized protein LOC106103885 n=1 Tax=Papilio polytes TaxID=76194 RepID=UPI000675E0D1|nr:PREDICTED: uncharacterized protein LOC106103885 [Papilio polytes]
MNRKRERNVNFTREETEKLVSLIETEKAVIEMKKSDSSTWQLKENAWNDIATKFNSDSPVYRDAKHLKLKYEALKRDVRKKWKGLHSKQHKSGEGLLTAMTPIELKIRDLILSVDQSDSTPNFDLLVLTGDEEVDESVTSEYSIQSDNLEVQINENEADDCKPSKIPCDKLDEGKLDILELQKKVLQAELEEKVMKKQMLKNEMLHKNEMYLLEKEKLLLQIDILRTDLKKRHFQSKHII